MSIFKRTLKVYTVAEGVKILSRQIKYRNILTSYKKSICVQKSYKHLWQGGVKERKII